MGVSKHCSEEVHHMVPVPILIPLVGYHKWQSKTSCYSFKSTKGIVACYLVALEILFVVRDLRGELLVEDGELLSIPIKGF